MDSWSSHECNAFISTSVNLYMTYESVPRASAAFSHERLFELPGIPMTKIAPTQFLFGFNSNCMIFLMTLMLIIYWLLFLNETNLKYSVISFCNHRFEITGQDRSCLSLSSTFSKISIASPRFLTINDLW